MMWSFKQVRIESYLCAGITKTTFLLLLLMLPILSTALPKSQPKQNHWFISGSTGVAFRSLNLSGGVNSTDKGFRHQPGFAFRLQFGKSFNNKWEPAIRWEAYTLFGQNDSPYYSSTGYYAAFPGLLQQEPLEYITQSNSLSFILRYLLSSERQNGNTDARIRPFIEAGLGINNFVNEVRFSRIPAGENTALIFRDRNGGNANGAAQFTTGLGLKIGAPEEWNAEILINADWVEFSSLNAVSRMVNPSGSSSQTIVSRITAGLTIPVKRTFRRSRYMPFRW